MKSRLNVLALGLIFAASSALAGNIVPRGLNSVGKLAESPNGVYRLELTNTGDLAIFDKNNKFIWRADESTGIVGKMTGDGCRHDGWQMQVYEGISIEDRKGCFKYLTKIDSNLPENAGDYTNYVLQDDGNLVAYLTNIRWKTGAYRTAAAGATQSVIIPPGTVMPRGTVYVNGNYSFRFQTDGNLVVYSGSTPIYNAELDGKGGVKAQMQYDGNFVVYDANDNAIWHTHTDGNQNAYMAFQPDGHLLIVKQDVIWARFGHQSTYWAPAKPGSPFFIPLGWLIPDSINNWL
ncbi:TPA: hypothetical protein VDT85_003744 [Pseudomonas aeruginosa]|uniref:hypothetical protein n=1 Tax=Pseudomonas aeruginosa TaxID=287 RepID=UPI000CF6C023|nr:hypothetical protein [Pseudomonas aeruginosa]ELM7153135.1 hypothetical protein [Pseudomonas aeruginosa]MBI7365785.1 hypothetical protein [Pseudomonas aeruginosa]MDI4072483.1 hypothetical protein [Pseudomonas aeruginosa]NPS70643.1 hypothetical protein [Pseudomonas aeruginosa]PQM09364.1 hypothetical protein C5F85_26755 [Pseudomonas aeruginosa]